MRSPPWTGSETPRVAACIASTVLPHVRRENEYARRGTWKHAFMVGAAIDRDAALAAVPDDVRASCEVIDVDALPVGADFLPEAAFAYNLDNGTARFLGQDLDRDYRDLAMLEIPLTIDIFSLLGDDAVFVADWKFGAKAVPPARRNWQLLIAALSACRAWGRSRARVAIVYVGEDGSPRFDWAELDAFDLDVAAAALVDLRERYLDAESQASHGRMVDVHAGAHCAYCPAFDACPANVALVRQMARDPRVLERDVALSPEHAADAYRLWRQAKAVIGAVGDRLHAYATVNGIDLGDGLRFGPVRTERESVDGPIARRVLASRYGAEVAEAACEYSTSKKAIGEALRPHAGKGKFAALQREALAAIDEAGGVQTKVSVTVKEHRVEPKALPAPADAREGGAA